MHENHWILELGRVALLMMVGAFGGIARLFNTDAEITRRTLLKHAFGGAVAAVSGASVAMWLSPGLNEKITLLVGLGVMAGFLGINAVSEFVVRRLDAHLKRNHLEMRLTDSLEHDTDSVELRRMMNTNEFNEEELEQLLEHARDRRRRIEEAMQNDRRES